MDKSRSAWTCPSKLRSLFTPSDDAIVSDAKRAFLLLIGCFVVLSIAAMLHLTVWFSETVTAVTGASKNPLELIISFFSSYGYIFFLAYAFSHPKPRTFACFCIAAALCAWLVHSLAPTLNLTTIIPGSFSLLGLIGALYHVINKSKINHSGIYEERWRWITGLLFFFLFIPVPCLYLTANLHPQTYDIFAFGVDKLLMPSALLHLIQWINAIPYGHNTVVIIYRLVPYSLAFLAFYQLRGKPHYLPSAILLITGMTSLAWAAFHAYPIAGPAYIFGQNFIQEYFSHKVVNLSFITLLPVPRNGMPSMHFGWMLAACIVWCQNHTPMWTRVLYIMATIIMAVAIILTGEHYFIDLIVAIPFVLSSIALCTTGISFNNLAKQKTIGAGFLLWLIWIVSLRAIPQTLTTYPLTLYLLTTLTVVGVLFQIKWMASFKNEPQRGCYPTIIVEDACGHIYARKFSIMFFASGMAALIYQVVFAKTLALIFGSTSIANLTVLATFLGGMALGSLLGGIIAHKSTKPLTWYASLETLIALYSFMTPVLFYWVQQRYINTAGAYTFDDPNLVMLRVVMGALVLLIPTILMGATLPILTQALIKQSKIHDLGSKVALLYFTNTAGAALGSFLTAYWIIPIFGVTLTIYLAVLLNLLVALLGFNIAKKLPPEVAISAAQSIKPQNQHLGLFICALLTLGVGGFLSLGLEVTTIHLLGMVVGNSVYAFGLMVSIFLIGLALGGETSRRILLSKLTPSTALAFSLLCLTGAMLFNLNMWNSIPSYFAGFESYPVPFPFSAREAIRALICIVVLLPPTFFIGISYPLAMELFTTSLVKPQALLLGLGAMVNTLGNVLGVVLFGWLILPRVGGFETIRLIALGEFILACCVMILSLRAYRQWYALCSTLIALCFVATSSLKLDYESVATGANVYFKPQQWGKILDFSESLDGGLTTVNAPQQLPPVIHTLLTNGKFQGNDAEQGELPAQVAFALTPLLHTTDRGSALVIGYGTGTTSRVVHDAGFKQLDIAELSADIVKLADAFFSPINNLVDKQKNTHLYITDGRNLLLLSKQKYDLVTIEVSSIWFAGAATLYNQEFYKLVREHLSPNGVLQQWVQLHHITPLDIITIISTLRSEFKYVSLYVVASQGMLIATNSPQTKDASSAAINALLNNPKLKDVKKMLSQDLGSLKGNLILSSKDIDNLLDFYFSATSMPISNDDNLYLEYSTPKGNVLDGALTYNQNLNLLKSFANGAKPGLPSVQ